VDAVQKCATERRRFPRPKSRWRLGRIFGHYGPGFLVRSSMYAWILASTAIRSFACLEKRAPRLRRRPPMPDHILRYRPSGLTSATRRGSSVHPQRIGAAHTPYQIAARYRPSVDASPAALPCPDSVGNPGGAIAPRSRAAPTAKKPARSSRASTTRPRKSGPSRSTVAAVGALSPPRAIAEAQGPPAPTRGACEQSFSMSQRGLEPSDHDRRDNGSGECKLIVPDDF